MTEALAGQVDEARALIDALEREPDCGKRVPLRAGNPSNVQFK